jgi:5,5'-dehydrodivanillate O-demethylase
MAIDFHAIGPDAPAGRFLRSAWQPIYLAARLPSGKARPVRILGENFTLYRGAGGAPHLLAERCAHRGTKLSIGRVEDDCLSCFYHGWTYAADGRCVAQPAEGRTPTDIAIASYPTREYLGLIFAYLGDGPPPALPRFDIYEQGFHVEAREGRRSWGYFNQLENSVDEVHFNFVHRRSAFADAGLNRAIPEILYEETEYGIKRIGKRGDSTRISHIIMPNCMYSMVFDHVRGWAEHLAWRVPVDETSHVSFMADCVHLGADALESYRAQRAEEKTMLRVLEPADSVVQRVLAGELDIDELPERPDLLSIQDGVALASQDERRDRRQDRLTESDRQVALLRRLWTRELLAIEQGKPLRQWVVPPALVPTTGVEETSAA